MMQAAFGIGLGLILLVWAASVHPKLWRVLIEQPADLLNRLTLKKVLLGLALIVLLFIFAQTAPADIALLFASDVLTYIEIAAALWLAAANVQARQLMRRMARQAIRQARRWRDLRRASAAVMTRLSARRERTTPKQVVRRVSRSDDPEPWAAFAWVELNRFAPAPRVGS